MINIINSMSSAAVERTMWANQCVAAEGIKNRFGVESALEYLVGEKLFTFVRSSDRTPESAADLLAFAAEARRLFTATELREYFDRLPRNPRLRPPRDNGESLRRYSRLRHLLQS